jgi:hypothetical protein
MHRAPFGNLTDPIAVPLPLLQVLNSVSLRAPHALALTLFTFAGLPAAAQEFDSDVLQEDAFEGDPIGIGGLEDLDRVPEPAPRTPRGPGHPPEPAVREGEVLHAVPAVRETHHRVQVELIEGLAVVRVGLRFMNGGSQAAGLRYRLAVPPDAEVAECAGCSTRWIRDERGLALEVHVPPWPERGEHRVQVTYVAPAPRVGGAVRWHLPARGADERIAPAAVTAVASHLLSPTVAGAPAGDTPVAIDPWTDAEVAAHAPTDATPRAVLWHFPCGDARCARARLSTGPRQAAPRDVILLIDASRSTLGPARNRMGVAFAALMGVMPAGSRMQAVAFASEARALQAEPVDPARVPMRPLVDATRADLGAATRFEAAWPTVRDRVRASRRAGRDPIVVLVGDGGLTQGDAGDRALAEAKRLRIPVHAVNLGDRPARPGLVDAVRRTGGLLLDAGPPAARAERGGPGAALEERVQALFAPVVAQGVTLRAGGRRFLLDSLRAGEEQVWEGPVPARPVLSGPGWRATARPAPDAVAAALGRRLARGDADRPVHVIGPPDPPADALAPPDDPLAGKGIPKDTVRVMLRQRLVPAARRCFRQDRRGRADHARRAEYIIRLAEREVIEARVQGDLPDALRRCLLGAVDGLDVPMFEGVVLVHYPVYTERAPDPPRLELEGPVADEVDAVTAGHPTTPRPP